MNRMNKYKVKEVIRMLLDDGSNQASDKERKGDSKRKAK